MQFIRDKAHGVVAWTIVGLIALAFCSWGVSGYLSNSSALTLAKVNGKKITSYEVEEAYNNWLRYVSMQKGFDMAQVKPAVIKKEIVRSLAEQQALITGLETDKFSVSDNLVVSDIRQDKNLQEGGSFSIERYKMFLSRFNISEVDFEQARRENLLVSQAQQSLVNSSFVLPHEVEQIIQYNNQKRDFSYVLISAAKFKTAIKIPEQQIADYYQQHLADFMAPEKIKLQYLELSIDDLMQSEKVTEQKLREFYKQNLSMFQDPETLRVRHIVVADKPKIDTVLAKLNNGESFTALAKQESIDKASADKGGDLGWITTADAYPAEVYNLAKVNDYTPAVKTDFGWHVFQLVARNTPPQKDFASVKKLVEARYRREIAEQQLGPKGEELAKLAAEQSQSLQAASEKLNLPIKTTDYFTRDGGAGIASVNRVREAAFSAELLNKQRNSDLLSLSNDNYIVIRVSDRQPQHQEDLADVRDRIVEKLTRQAAQAQAEKLGADFLDDIKQGVNPKQAASNKKLDLRTATAVGRDNKTIAAPILRHVFAMQKPEAGSNVKAGFILPNGDYVVLVLNAVQNGKLGDKDSDSLREVYNNQIAALKGRLEFDSWRAALIERAKIKYME